MSRQELKTAIDKLLEHSSDQVLNEIFEYLQSMNNTHNDTQKLSMNLRKILMEDQELLKRLAQ